MNEDPNGFTLSFWQILVVLVVLVVVGELLYRARRKKPTVGKITVNPAHLPAGFKGRATVHVQVRRANGELERAETITQEIP